MNLSLNLILVRAGFELCALVMFIIIGTFLFLRVRDRRLRLMTTSVALVGVLFAGVGLYARWYRLNKAYHEDLTIRTTRQYVAMEQELSRVDEALVDFFLVESAQHLFDDGTRPEEIRAKYDRILKQRFTPQVQQSIRDHEPRWEAFKNARFACGHGHRTITPGRDVSTVTYTTPEQTVTTDFVSSPDGMKVAAYRVTTGK